MTKTLLYTLAFTVHSAFALPITGSYTGIFISPVPTSPPAVTTGLGTSSVSWGIPCNGITNCTTSPGGITPPSSFTFTTIPFTTEIGQPFVLGQIQFFNGTVQPGTALDQVTLFLNGFAITPTEFAGPDSRVITILNTPNTGDPIANADKAIIPVAFFPAANEFGVFESQAAIATLLGEFTDIADSVLQLKVLGFGEVTSGGGFVSGFAPSPIPEPSTVPLVIAGLLGLSRRFYRPTKMRSDHRRRTFVRATA